MIALEIRLEFEHVFPDEPKLSALEYLSLVSKETLLKSIGFFNTQNLPNFNNWFSNPEIKKDVTKRTIEYFKANPIKKAPVTCGPDSCLKVAEVILSNRDQLIDNNTNLTEVDTDEINLFKAFLVINSELNQKIKYDNISEDNLQKLVDLSIIFSFTISDLPAYQNNNFEFLKLVHVTLVKIQHLLNFLDSKNEYHLMRDALFNSFNLSNREQFNKQVKYLFGKLFELKAQNGYRFKVEDYEAKKFLDSMILNEGTTDQDFTFLKINPILKLEEGMYSIVHFFFVVDKFYRGAKFKLKEIYNSDPVLKSNHGNFFNFFNKKFSEEFLMRSILDSIFSKPYQYKIQVKDIEAPNEPDYYIRQGNSIFLFENKDVMVAQGIKASGNIDQINEVLRKKFLEDEGKPVGIGQLINSIQQIKNNKFEFDKYVNSKNGLKIYPILLVHDRIFQSLGINYQLDQLYQKSLITAIGDNYDSSKIKGLTILDIDTLILLRSYLKQKDKNFRSLLDSHLSAMNSKIKVSTPNREDAVNRVNKRLTDKIRPIAYREIGYKFDSRELIELFSDVLK